MANFYKDNQDLVFALDNLDLAEAVALKENNYKFAAEFETAPHNYADALDNFRRVMDVAGEICGDRIEPRAAKIDEDGGAMFANGVVTYHELTQKNLQDIAQADLNGVILPHRFGGLNFPVTLYTMLMEMISRADASLQNLIGLQDIAETISEFGSEEQKAKYLPMFSAGEVDGSMDLTEPDYGSDLQAVRLRAWQDEKTGQWYLNGNKRFITNGCAKVHLVLARSEDGTHDGRGLSMFIAENCPELVVRRIEHKFGIKGVATCELQYNDVPAQLVGKRRFGLIKYVMSLMNGARVAISSQALGVAEAAYRQARKYAAEREQFRKTIDQFPPVYEMLASMKSKVVGARTLLYETTRAVDLRNGYNHLVENSENVTPEQRAKQKYYNKISAVLTPMCKALSTEIANQVAYDGLQVHGGSGYMRDFPAERFTRDARITNIYEGTTQLQVVAAVGGVIQRDNADRINELLALNYTGKLARLKKEIEAMLEKHEKAIAFVVDRKDPVYHDLVARGLVENETYIFVGLLMLRDALKCEDRTVLAERWINDAKWDFEKRYLRTVSGDASLIDNRNEIINY